jgi:signal transduction histidine kinase
MTKLFSTLRSRLMLFALLATLPALGTTLYTVIEQRREAANAAQVQVSRLAQVAVVNQDIYVENTRLFMLAVSHLTALRNNDMASCQEIFSHLITEHETFYATVYVADLDGNVVCNAPSKHFPDNPQDCVLFQEILKTKDFGVSNYHICEKSGKVVLSMGYPVLDYNNNVILVLKVSLDLLWINKLASDVELPPGSTLTVFEPDGTILAHYPDSENWVTKPLPADVIPPEIIQAGSGTAISSAFDGGSRLYAVASMQDTPGSALVSLGIPAEVAFEQANRMLWQNLIVLAIVSLAALASFWVLSNIFILRQTRSLVKTTLQLAAGDLHSRTEIPYTAGELGQLAQAFDQMAESLALRETERDQAELAMKEYASDLERSNRDLQEFAYIASHDLQEPLRKIQTFGELVQLRYDPVLDERGRDYLQRMRGAANRMQSLINELLTYSRLTSKAGPIGPVDLNEVVKTVLSDLEFQLDQAHTSIQVDSLPTVEADLTQMYQLMQNLIGNALKFHLPDRPPLVRISAQPVNSRAPSGPGKSSSKYYRIAIEDNGIGFEEKYLDRIFQPFQRLHGRGEYEGTGMGLAICRKIVERHGGLLTAHSQPGKGSTFVIELSAKYTQGNEAI